MIALLQSHFSVCGPCVCFYSAKQLELPQQLAEEPPVRLQVEEQKRYVESLRQEIQAEQRQVEKDLEREQAHLQQQHAESKGLI